MRKEKVEIKDNGEEMPEICHKTSYKKVSVPLLERIGIKVLRCNKCKKITNIVLDDGNEFCECETGF